MNVTPDLALDTYRADPRIALGRTFPAALLRPGPLPAVEWCITLDGSRPVALAAAARLADPDWFAVLDEPKIHVQPSGSSAWQGLPANRDGQVDQVAVSWPYLHPDVLRADEAGRRMGMMETFADAIGRRAVASLPVVAIRERVALLSDLIGRTRRHRRLVFRPAQADVPEREIWRVCAGLDLDFGPEGTFEYRTSINPFTLLTVRPDPPAGYFSLSGANRGATCREVEFLINVPRCPNPSRAVVAALQSGRAFCERIGGTLVDEQGRFVQATVAQEWIESVIATARELESAGLAPGTSEAITLFT
jgi:hypothetical protein